MAIHRLSLNVLGTFVCSTMLDLCVYFCCSLTQRKTDGERERERGGIVRMFVRKHQVFRWTISHRDFRNLTFFSEIPCQVVYRNN